MFKSIAFQSNQSGTSEGFKIFRLPHPLALSLKLIVYQYLTFLHIFEGSIQLLQKTNRFWHNQMSDRHDPTLHRHNPTLHRHDPTLHRHDPTLHRRNPALHRRNPMFLHRDPTFPCDDPTLRNHIPILHNGNPTSDRSYKILA